jgi:uncharacterized coiled-coil protein SlyX
LEHRYKKHGSEFETTIQNLEQRSAKAEKEFAKLTKLLDERDKELKLSSKREKGMVGQL